MSTAMLRRCVAEFVGTFMLNFMGTTTEELDPRHPKSEEQVWEEEVKEASSGVKP